MTTARGKKPARSPKVATATPERVVTPADLERRLRSIDGAAQRVLVGAGAVPAMVTLLAFSDDDHGAARAFGDDLRERFREERPDLHVEVLQFDFPRPRGLKAAWQEPRVFIDYAPSQAELADLRPDLRPPPPGVTRRDWIPDAHR